jgi:hypothetical protein
MWLAFVVGVVIIGVTILFFTGNLPNTDPWVKKQVGVDSLSLDDLSSSCPRMERITEKLGEPSKYMQLFSEPEVRKLESIHRGCQAVKNIESTVGSLSLDDLDESCRKIGELRARYGEPSTNTQLFSESVRRRIEDITSACVRKNQPK